MGSLMHFPKHWSPPDPELGSQRVLGLSPIFLVSTQRDHREGSEGARQGDTPGDCGWFVDSSLLSAHSLSHLSTPSSAPLRGRASSTPSRQEETEAPTSNKGASLRVPRGGGAGAGLRGCCLVRLLAGRKEGRR